MFLEPGENRSALQQAAFQLAALVVTLVVAIVSGLLTGKISIHLLSANMIFTIK